MSKSGKVMEMTRALILSTNGLQFVSRCMGPDTAGNCPGALRGETVACAGRVMAPIPSVGGARPFIWAVEPDAKVCPLAALGPLFAGGPPAKQRSES